MSFTPVSSESWAFLFPAFLDASPACLPSPVPISWICGTAAFILHCFVCFMLYIGEIGWIFHISSVNESWPLTTADDVGTRIHCAEGSFKDFNLWLICLKCDICICFINDFHLSVYCCVVGYEEPSSPVRPLCSCFYNLPALHECNGLMQPDSPPLRLFGNLDPSPGALQPL